MSSGASDLPYRTRYRLIIQTWAHLNIRWLEKSCGLGFRVTGTEHVPDGHAIIFCKHQSDWETFALQEVFPPYVWVLRGVQRVSTTSLGLPVKCRPGRSIFQG